LPRAGRSRDAALSGQRRAAERRDTLQCRHSASVVDPASPDGEIAGLGAILRVIDWPSTQDITLIIVSLAGPFDKLLDRGSGTAPCH